MIDPHSTVEITDGRKIRWVRPGSEADYPGWYPVDQKPVKVTMHPPASKIVDVKKVDNTKPTLEE